MFLANDLDAKIENSKRKYRQLVAEQTSIHIYDIMMQPLGAASVVRVGMLYRITPTQKMFMHSTVPRWQ